MTATGAIAAAGQAAGQASPPPAPVQLRTASPMAPAICRAAVETEPAAKDTAA